MQQTWRCAVVIVVSVSVCLCVCAARCPLFSAIASTLHNPQPCALLIGQDQQNDYSCLSSATFQCLSHVTKCVVAYIYNNDSQVDAPLSAAVRNEDDTFCAAVVSCSSVHFCV